MYRCYTRKNKIVRISMSKLIIANFKMNKTESETKDYLINFLSKFEDDKADLILAVPFTSISTARYMLSGRNISLSAQNICEDDKIGCTGEISGKMLADSGVRYVIVGHSERRNRFKENSKMINNKIKNALKNRLTAILCVGESLADKNTMKTLVSLKSQIEEALKGLYENELDNIVIAYEPVWAIGSGKTPSTKDVEMAVKSIRKVVSDDFSSKAGEQIRIVYGGSINPKNISKFSNIDGLNGILVGTASLDSNIFMQIINSMT